MKLLKHKPDLLEAKVRQLIGAKLEHVNVVETNCPYGWCVKRAN